MQENYKEILSHLSTEIDQETLLLYLQGKLTEEKNMKLKRNCWKMSLPAMRWRDCSNLKTNNNYR